MYTTLETQKELDRAALAELLRRTFNKSRLSYREAAPLIGLKTPATFTKVMKEENITNIAFVRILTFIHLELKMSYNEIMEFILKVKSFET